MNGKFVLGLDLDGVVMNYTTGFRSHVSKVKNIHPDLLPEPSSWNYEGWPIGGRDEFEELHTEAVRSGMFLSSPVMEDASEMLWKLSDEGVYIRIITNRFVGKGNHAVAGADTFRWLDCMKIPFRDICFVADKTDVQANIYIDDSPKNLEALMNAAKSYQRVIAFDMPYNKPVKTDLRVYNWAEAYKVISDHHSNWKMS